MNQERNRSSVIPIGKDRSSSPNLVIPTGAERSERSGGTCFSLQLRSWLSVPLSRAEYRGRAALQRRVSFAK